MKIKTLPKMENEKSKATHDVNKLTNQVNKLTAGAKNQNLWCFAWFKEADESKANSVDRAVSANAYQWATGSRITITFLDGDPVLQDRVRHASLQWTSPGQANLTLDFRINYPQADIRISFCNPGSWSMIGTSCLNYRIWSEPTMNFGWLSESTSDEELERVVLHEFGHALGLIHEHTHPEGDIKWNRQQVINDLSGPPNNWSVDTIERNVFKAFSLKETNFTVFDPKSIMMYPIPATWTTNEFSLSLNKHLSESDKTFIKEIYP